MRLSIIFMYQKQWMYLNTNNKYTTMCLFSNHWNENGDAISFTIEIELLQVYLRL